MNQSQIKYIVNRLQEEYERKKEQIKDKYPEFIFGREYGRIINERKLPLKYNEAEIRALCIKYPNKDIIELFETAPYIETRDERAEKRHNALASLRARVNTLKDNIMLGDAKDALDQLNDFIKEEF